MASKTSLQKPGAGGSNVDGSEHCFYRKRRAAALRPSHCTLPLCHFIQRTPIAGYTNSLPCPRSSEVAGERTTIVASNQAIAAAVR
ncbi:hypothetical protein L1049_018649 [Liquidambar formosana]|uniref:Uncharacterized protein n=1 Tax=Liquidambar formosana TaxID=63359 RepID=A0AAP0RAD0_LIQFO